MTIGGIVIYFIAQSGPIVYSSILGGSTGD